MKPILDSFKTLIAADVVDEEDALDASEVLAGKGPVLFLAGGVPDYILDDLRYSLILFPTICFMIFLTSMPMVRRLLDSKVWLVYLLARLVLPTLDSPSRSILTV